MTDAELIARLWDADLYNAQHYERDPLHKQAADRIEALIAENAKLHDHIEGVAKDTHKIMVGYEAKLAQAVEALEKLARLGNGDRYGNSEGNMIARATLAEIKGESHD